MTVQDIRTRLSLRQAVDRFGEDLVGRADRTMSEEQVKTLKQWKTQLRLGQLNNLLGVALETDSPAVIINWVSYQMGRRETKGGWGDSGLGDQVVDDIKALETSARQVAQSVYGGETPDEVRQAHVRLVRRYAGYLKRWFVARGGQ
jgi:hypothetical protein